MPSNIGAALISSMATLTNGSEPMPEMSCTSNLYGSEMNDLIYLNNGSTTVNTNGSEYLLTDLLSEEDLHLIEMSASSNQTLPHYQHHYQSNHFNSHHNQTVVNNTNEDCMDASSDSAVSSMSSDRIHSLSDNVSYIYYKYIISLRIRNIKFIAFIFQNISFEMKVISSRKFRQTFETLNTSCTLYRIDYSVNVNFNPEFFF